MVAGSLRRALGRFAAELREEFGRPAMNRRILHRLAVAEEADLARLGLTPRDVRDAAAPDIADATSFLAARRAARSGVAGQSSLRRGERIQFE